MSTVWLIRHAEKKNPKDTGTLSGLSINGKVKAFGWGAKRIGSIASITHSGLERARITAQLIKTGAEINLILETDERLRYSGKASQEYVKYLQDLGDEEKMVAALLETGSVRPDDETWSSQEVGEAIFSLVKEKLESPGNHLLISHSGMIESLEALLKKTHSLSALGWSLNYLQGLKFNSNTSEIRVEFRGNSGDTLSVRI